MADPPGPRFAKGAIRLPFDAAGRIPARGTVRGYE